MPQKQQICSKRLPYSHLKGKVFILDATFDCNQLQTDKNVGIVQLFHT